MHHILLIDDDEHLAPPLAAYLRRFDLELLSALRPSDGLARLAEGGVDAVILDVMLPEMDGFEVCRRIRRDSDIPVLMLTARGDLTDRVVGLELGADDYLPKPFEPRELAARLQTILRRVRPAAAEPPATQLRFDGLLIDTERREVRRQGEAIELTGTEFELLLLLAREPHKVWSRDDILNRLRGRDADLYTRAVDILVSRLRRKLEPVACIKTLRNAGYTFALARSI
ncbi:response regulator transcription factor [Aquabacterium sp.]|uniref:response regulator transcription factor n=1 Tax=Aquabacterium sp. TaxID=1872578 RepID=UPI002B54244E|nr:response regulator transcription factor [Aquabacterium sp.]HSW08257.1 response regulator transcription factor [Aquabacterium sp.]